MKKKVTELDEALCMYKCRICQKKYFNLVGRWDININILHLLGAIDGTNTSIHSPKLLDIHSCNENQTGIADFIGIKRRITKF